MYLLRIIQGRLLLRNDREFTIYVYFCDDGSSVQMAVRMYRFCIVLLSGLLLTVEVYCCFFVFGDSFFYSLFCVVCVF